MESAKTILLNHTLTTEASKGKKKAKIEFQAYAYRLAHDLNDLNHLRIYMKLAKNVERPLLEQAYSFVADSRTSEKGKLFLWKLKKIREEINRERNKNNFSYDYVVKKQSEFKNVFAKEIIAKQDSEITSEILDVLKPYLEIPNKRILVIGNTSKKVLKILEKAKPKANVIDISKNVNRLNNSEKVKIICKDFLKNSYKDDYFDIVLFNNSWNQIPTETEIKFLKEVRKKSKKNTLYLLLCKKFSTNSEAWQEFESQKQIYCCYVKKFTQKSLMEQFSKFSLKVEKEHKLDDYYLLSFLIWK